MHTKTTVIWFMRTNTINLILDFGFYIVKSNNVRRIFETIIDFEFYSGNDIFRIILTILAVLNILVLAVRKIFKLENYITICHVEILNKVLLSFNSLVGLLCLLDLLLIFHLKPLYRYEEFTFGWRKFGNYYVVYSGLLIFQIILLQLFWKKNLRKNVLVTFMVCSFIGLFFFL